MLKHLCEYNYFINKNINVTSNHTNLIPWLKIEFLLVLQIIKSAHWTTTIETKKAV